jgi:hypothetical protein
MPSFSVDTHVFRELGELLVGRDSTALIELIKNSYDADATEVVVYGEKLDDLEKGMIKVADNGVGMDVKTFSEGFLRIAARTRDTGNRRSILFKRRYTGAKGIGRLAAHKLGDMALGSPRHSCLGLNSQPCPFLSPRCPSSSIAPPG